jgi:hypothetical protein
VVEWGGGGVLIEVDVCVVGKGMAMREGGVTRLGGGEQAR